MDAHDPLAELKRRAAVSAAAEVQSGTCVGLGTGSTAAFAIEELGRRLKAGELADVVGVPTSRRTAALATQHGIRLIALDGAGPIDLAIDGADEVDPRGDLIKGAGGALLLEKAVETRAGRLLIIVDHTKLVDKLGTRAALPVELDAGSWAAEREALAALGCDATLRTGAQGPYVTDGGNFIVDCRFAGGIADPAALARELATRPAVRAHGLFLGMASEVVVAEPHGVRRVRLR